MLLTLLVLAGASLFMQARTDTPAGSVRAVVFGDFGTGSAAQTEVARLVGELDALNPIDAVVWTGDNVYPDGDPALFHSMLTEPYRPVLDDAMLVATLGNHDTEAGHGAAQFRYLGHPSLPAVRTVASGDVDVAFFVLDSNAPLLPQGQWLATALEESEAEYRIVVLHHPPYTCSMHSGDRSVRTAIVPVLERHRVELVLSGHNHLYERFESPAGVSYIVSGGGGADLYPVAECTDTEGPAREIAQSVHHVVELEATAVRLSVRAVTTSGEVFDRFEVRSATRP